MNYHPTVIFWLVFGALSFIIVYLDRKNDLLRDTSEARPRPYSFSRMQLTWWTVIVLAAFITILIVKKVCPTLWESTLILIGISSATMTTARMIDASDQSNPTVVSRHQDEASTNLILDILSDEKGVSIHRLQTVLFNITFGVWFIIMVIKGLNDAAMDADHVMPQIEPNNLVLLGLSSALYAGLKTTENKQPEKPVPPEQVPDEAELHQSDALG